MNIIGKIRYHLGLKEKQLWYYEEAVNNWIPLPEKMEYIIEPSSLMNGEVREIQIKRFDMSEKAIEKLPCD